MIQLRFAIENQTYSHLMDEDQARHVFGMGVEHASFNGHKLSEDEWGTLGKMLEMATPDGKGPAWKNPPEE
jgi:hypothetical protein